MTKLKFLNNTVPKDARGFTKSRRKGKTYQYACHEDGCEIRRECDILVSWLHEYFDQTGYSRDLHAALTEIKAKYSCDG